MERGKKARLIVGWAAVAVTAAFTGVWTYWGIVENFHEGWYSSSLWENLAMLFFQYLSIPIAYTALAAVSLRWPKAGLGLHIAVALFAAWFFSGASFSVVGVLIVLPIAGLGLLFFFGRPEPRKWAYALVVALPLAIILCIAPIRLAQVSRRVNDGDFGARLVEGRGVALVWAPRGPGWPDGGVTLAEAEDICRRLSPDGLTVTDEAQGVWRLPTVEEAVRSMALHGENAGGQWDPDTAKAVYQKTPDKETPLWDPHSRVIYYWVTGCGEEGRAYIVTYAGGVFTRPSGNKYGYLTFRAVKDAE